MPQVIHRALAAGCAFAMVLSFFALSARADVSQTNSATVSGSITDASSNPVAGATISLSGPKHASTQTDVHGLFVFLGVPLGTYIIAATSSAGTVQREISVQADVNVAITYEPANGLKTIATVNTSAKFNITPASVTHVNPMDLAMQGQTSWRKILEQIPGVVQAGNGSGNNTFGTMPDSPLSPVLVSINGGLPYETATLLDDMPLISGSNVSSLGGSGTDLSVYPLNGFSGADVVRGPGSGAPSILNSIGGSLVLHMPGVVTSEHYGFSISTDAYGGYIGNAQLAVRWKKLSASASYGFDDSPGPFTGQSPLTFLNSPSGIDGKSYAKYTPPCPASLTCSGTNLLAPGFSSSPTAAIYGQNTGILACCTNMSAPWTMHSGSLALAYTVSPSLTVQVAYAGQQSNALVSNEYQYNIFSPPPGYAGGLRGGIYTLPVASCFNAPYSGTSALTLFEEKVTAQVGRGVLKVAALQNRIFNSLTSIEPSSGTQQLYGGAILCAISTPTCGSAGNPGTLTIFNGETHTVTPNQINTIEKNGAENRDQLISYETPIGKIYAGASYVQSYYTNLFDESQTRPALSSTTLVQFPAQLSETTRETRLFFGGNPSERTTLDLSMYFVNGSYHVPDPSNPNYTAWKTPGPVANSIPYVNTSFNYAAPRIGFVWRPASQIAVRASIGGGIALPPLSDLTGSTNAIPTYISFLNVYTESPPNFNLQPEKAAALDIGTDIRLRNNTQLSFDVFQANLTGQLYSFSSVNGTFNDGVHGVAPLIVGQYVNLTASRYQGLSVEIHHTPAQGMTWGMAGGLTRGYVVSTPPRFYNQIATVPCNFTTGAGCTNLSVVPGVNFSGTYQTGAGGSSGGASVPYAQANGDIGYRWHKGRSVGLHLTYYGNNNSYFRPPFITIDGNMTYPMTNQVSLSLNFTNLTGIYGGGIQAYGPQNFTSAPTIVGLPYALYGGQVGPRSVHLVLSGSL